MLYEVITVTPHERDAGALDRDVRARPHRDADVGCCEGGGSEVQIERRPRFQLVARAGAPRKTHIPLV